ncbi:hypothetical protein AABB24_036986 [Solanum stoloniferum]|uniref:Uncharacterized protein n=1 Tax=Solanum stoloniferum TaxID=62892 RepID=A0ABD2R2V3_9SOLN
MTHSAQDSDSDKREDQVNPLIIPLETAPCQEEVVKTWFTQDVFVETKEQDMLDKYNSEDEMLIDQYLRHRQLANCLLQSCQRKEWMVCSKSHHLGDQMILRLFLYDLQIQVIRHLMNQVMISTESL